jgi:hypothetical protein
MPKIDRRRSPSQLRDLLEVRVRRMARTYDVDVRRQALTEIRDLADAALRYLGGDDHARR